MNQLPLLLLQSAIDHLRRTHLGNFLNRPRRNALLPVLLCVDGRLTNQTAPQDLAIFLILRYIVKAVQLWEGGITKVLISSLLDKEGIVEIYL